MKVFILTVPDPGRDPHQDLSSSQEGRYYSEEAEVDLRDPGRDYELYKYTCQELQRLMAEIQDLKSKGSKDVVRRRARHAKPGMSASWGTLAVRGWGGSTRDLPTNLLEFVITAPSPATVTRVLDTFFL